ncbi:MAG: hypothetical protein OEW67_08560 [Cyclobacteriaceae bacterium]|nr:hypothetical protein [Cyclobacteriaceae bacterium]
MTFEEYLASKKIDSIAFKKAEKELWTKFEFLFDQMHPKSFTMQKLNLINGIRRKYPLKEIVEKKEVKPKTKRPIIRPKI